MCTIHKAITHGHKGGAHPGQQLLDAGICLCAADVLQAGRPKGQVWQPGRAGCCACLLAGRLPHV
jgi:hypothetical protein